MILTGSRATLLGVIQESFAMFQRVTEKDMLQASRDEATMAVFGN